MMTLVTKIRTRFRNAYVHFYKPHYRYVDVAMIVARYMRHQGHHRVENCELCDRFVIVRVTES